MHFKFRAIWDYSNLINHITCNNYHWEKPENSQGRSIPVALNILRSYSCFVVMLT